MTVVSPCTRNLMDSAHPHTVLSKLNEQRSQGLFCDVTIVVEDVKFRAHRNVLAACSGYFRNALTTPETWSSSQVLELMDLKSEVFANILNFIYCSKVTSHSAEDTGSLVAAGKRLRIPFLEKFAEQETQHLGMLPNLSDSTDCSEAPVPEKTKKEVSRLEEIDSARGPRITNAFSINEVCPGNNPFTPLGQPNKERQSPDVGQLPSSCPTTSCLSMNTETTQTLSEHSYAVSQAADENDNSERDNKKLCKPLISQPKQLLYRNAGPLKKRHRLRGTLGKSILPTPAAPHIDNASTTSQTLDNGGTEAPVAGLTPPPLISVANTEKSFESGPPMAADDAQNELGPPTLSPQTEESISVYSCEQCPELFTNQALLAIHTAVHKKRFVSHLFCEFCHRKFIHHKRLRNHEQVCPKAERGPPEYPSETLIPEVKSCSENQANEEDILVDILSTDDVPKTPNVDQSEQIQAEKAKIPSANQRRYNCSVCKRVYVTLSSLKRHENVHSWQRAYPCHYCNKVFALAEYRTKHEIWHTGERRYQCIFCLETFMTYYILKNHQKSFHGIDPSLAVKKSANGGLKSSVYPIKLYRLLPMKFRKRGYKTYSHTYSESSEGDQAAQENSLIPPFEDNIHNTSVPLTFMATTKMIAPVVPHITVDKPCDQSVDQSNTLQSVPNYETGDKDPPFMSYDSTLPLQSDTQTPAVVYTDHSTLLINSLNSVKKLSELSASAKKVEEMTKELLQLGTENLNLTQDKNENTETYIAKPACLGPSVDGDPLPLCQITVKIGNEAIIRRRIKGSKLFPKKKRRISEISQVDNSSQSLESRINAESPRLRLRQEAPKTTEPETYDDSNDCDTADMLWRPYYSYKAKKKRKKMKLNPNKHMFHGLMDSSVAIPEAHIEKSSWVTEERNSAGNGELKRSLSKNSLIRPTYNCDICDSSFITENGLRAHIIGSHPCFCRTCGKQGPPGEVPAGGDYVCKRCMENGSCFDSMPRSPSTEKRYRCSFCPQRFHYLATKKSHEKKHQNVNENGFNFEGFSEISKYSAHESEVKKQDSIKEEESDSHNNIDIKTEEDSFSIDRPKTEETELMSLPRPTSPCYDPQFSLTAQRIKHKKSKKRFDDLRSIHSMHLPPKKKTILKHSDGKKEMSMWPGLNNDYEKSNKLLWRPEIKGPPTSKHRPEKLTCKEEPMNEDI